MSVSKKPILPQPHSVKADGMAKRQFLSILFINIMKRSTRTGVAVVCALVISATQAQTKPADPAIPHLEKRGLATQLIVDGKPFLVLGAEPPTSAPSNLEYLRYMMQVMADTGHQNSAAIAIGWSWIEPEKGKYDFRIVDTMI